MPLRVFLSLCFVLSLIGCGGAQPSQSKEELDKAEGHVHAALEAWKKGDAPDKLKSQSIEVTDHEWKAGVRLLDYKLNRTEGLRGENVRCWAQLTLQNRQGKKVDRDVVYEVSVKDKVVIGRDPMN